MKQHAGFASTKAATLKQAGELPSVSLSSADAQTPKIAGLIGQKAGVIGTAYSEALSAEGREALTQAVKQLRITIFSADQLRYTCTTRQFHLLDRNPLDQCRLCTFLHMRLTVQFPPLRRII